MGVQFRLTVADDRIELEHGACSIMLDRTSAQPHDYVVAANVAGTKALHDLLLSMAPAQPEVDPGPPLGSPVAAPPELGEPIADLAVKIDRRRLANQAKATREKMDDSQSVVAAAIGVDQSYVSRMERGDTHMRDVTAIDIARRVISHYSSAANEKPLPTRFGSVLRAARKAKHLTTDALGEQVGLSRNYILKIEKDPYAGAPRATVERIATHLGVKNVERFYREREAA